jgi:hypothetical protein
VQRHDLGQLEDDREKDSQLSDQLAVSVLSDEAATWDQLLFPSSFRTDTD